MRRGLRAGALLGSLLGLPMCASAWAQAAVPAVPAPPAVAAPAAAQPALRLAPVAGTLLEYRVDSATRVTAAEPDVISLDPDIPDGVLAARLEASGAFGGPEWLALQKEFSGVSPTAKFFIKVLSAPAGAGAGTVQLAVTYLQPPGRGEPGRELRTRHTLRPDGTAIRGEVVRAGGAMQDAADDLRRLSPDELWRVALSNAGFEPAGVYGQPSPHTVTVTNQPQPLLKLAGLLSPGDTLAAPVLPLSTRVAVTRQGSAGGWTVTQEAALTPWQTRIEWQEDGRAVSLPYELAEQTTRTVSRYRPDGLPQSAEASSRVRSLLGMPPETDVPVEVVVRLTSEVTVKARLVRTGRE